MRRHDPLFRSGCGAATEDFNAGTASIGTGPFMLAENNPNLRMVLVRNPNFRGEAWPADGTDEDRQEGLLDDAGTQMPFIERAIYSLEKEAIPRWNKFLQGYYDNSGIGSDSFDQAVQFGSGGEARLTPSMTEKGIRLSTAVETSVFYTGFNMKDPLVGGDSQRARLLRRAISIALEHKGEMMLTRLFERLRFMYLGRPRPRPREPAPPADRRHAHARSRQAGALALCRAGARRAGPAGRDRAGAVMDDSSNPPVWKRAEIESPAQGALECPVLVLAAGPVDPHHAHHEDRRRQAKLAVGDGSAALGRTLRPVALALLIGLPLAWMAAIYTSEFLHPRAKARIKPVIALKAGRHAAGAEASLGRSTRRGPTRPKCSQIDDEPGPPL